MAEEAAIEIREGEWYKVGSAEWKHFRPSSYEVVEFDVALTNLATGHAGQGAFIVLEGEELIDGSYGMSGKFIGSDCEELVEAFGSCLNRRKKQVHLCGEDPCGVRNPDYGLHVQGAKWWKLENFPQGYLKAWAKSVVNEYIKGAKEGVAAKDVVTRQSQPAKPPEGDPSQAPDMPPEKAAPKDPALHPAVKSAAKKVTKGGIMKRPARSSQKEKIEKGEKDNRDRGRKRKHPPEIPPWDLSFEEGGDPSGYERTSEEDEAEVARRAALKAEMDGGEPEGLKRRLRELTKRLVASGQPLAQEVVEVRSDSEEDLGAHGSRLPQDAVVLRTGTNLDPRRSQLAVMKTIKQQDTKDGVLKPKKRKMKIGSALRKSASTGSALVAAAEWQQRQGRKEREKKKEKKESKKTGAKALVNLLLGKRGKKKKGGRDRDGMDPSEGSSDEDSSSSEESSGESSEMMGPLKKRSHRRPGAVLRMLVRHARETLDQSAVVGVEAEEGVTGGVKLASYFNLMIRPYHSSASRDLKEMHMLAQCMDELRTGQLEKLGDSLAARFLAIHTAVNDGNWKTAQFLELHPLDPVQGAPTSVLLEARKHSKVVDKSLGRDQSWKKGWNHQQEWEDPKGKGKGKRKGGKGKKDGKGWERRPWGNWRENNSGSWWDQTKEKPDGKDGKEKEKEKK